MAPSFTAVSAIEIRQMTPLAIEQKQVRILSLIMKASKDIVTLISDEYSRLITF